MKNGTLKISDIDVRDAFFDELYRLAKKDPDLIFLAADMGAFSLDRFKAELPRQYINMGVAEQNMVSVAAGLALSGKKVFIYSIAPFVTQRCYEQIKVNISGMRLPVTIIGVGGGITYSSDGPTHHAVQDIAIMRALPEMAIFNPADSSSAAAATRLAYQSRGPVYVRIDKGKLPLLYEPAADFSAGIAELRQGKDLTIVSTGVMVSRALAVAGELAKHDIEAGVIDVYRLKPLNGQLLLSLIGNSKRLVTIEEHSIIGGLGSAVSEMLADNGKSLPLKRIGIPEISCPGYGDREWMQEFYGLDEKGITRKVLDFCQAENPKIASQTWLRLEVKDFARLFGTTVDDISEDCRELIDKLDFRYRALSGEENEATLLTVLKTLDSGNLSVAGAARQGTWEKGWSENLRSFMAGNYDLKELLPKFVKHNEKMRLIDRYIQPHSPDFETSLVTVLRTHLFQKYFRNSPEIFEFGCGTGLNLVALAKMFREKKLTGLDWSAASMDILEKIRETHHLDISGIRFDMFAPDYGVDVSPGSAAFTIGAMEQLGTSFEAFLQFLLEKKFSICINIETTYELYDQSSLFDYVAAKYLEKRGYLRGYLTRLKQLEHEGSIKILKSQRSFGSLFHDGYSFTIWQPAG